MSVSALFILDSKGKIIISRDYRGDVRVSCVDRFVQRLVEEDESSLKPVFEEDGINYIYVKHNNVFLLAVTRRNADATMVLLFLHTIIKVFEEYFSALEEESIRDNFVITYELLDEMMDFGYPQTTEPQLLKQYITQKGHKLNKAQVTIPASLTGPHPWRPPDIKYRKNEVFLDVIEKVNLLIGSNGAILNSEIIGQVMVKCYLSGVPVLRLGLNDRVQFSDQNKATQSTKGIDMEDVKFHQCVSLSRFDEEGIISFVPPDGEFELLSYRLSANIKPLYIVEAIVDSHAHSRVEYLVKVRSQYKPRSVANNVKIVIPVPPDADSPRFRASIGSVQYSPGQNCIIWTIRQFSGEKEFLMRAHFGLPSIVNEEEEKTMPPISVEFEIPYFTVSGIQVRYLKITEPIEKYTALPWVRYITQNGQYQIRTT
uniref:MHD domain-containing protein n=1 Tax=Arcella intermedia TaxID=1963864 RepID=A0A6B2L4Z2_9EUKA|eukprot:TRINITY_DN5104_c0_g1_i1.p1 TRINITY_DN5104_c0_g1~~TRINITY_DN5104_c0_g1_i1.p1  ORF type:complete len:427 (-),score=86.29 TRINITY_DN5104_c0_g1_i1:30-1310(-)